MGTVLRIKAFVSRCGLRTWVDEAKDIRVSDISDAAIIQGILDSEEFKQQQCEPGDVLEAIVTVLNRDIPSRTIEHTL